MVNKILIMLVFLPALADAKLITHFGDATVYLGKEHTGWSAAKVSTGRWTMSLNTDDDTIISVHFSTSLFTLNWEGKSSPVLAWNHVSMEENSGGVSMGLSDEGYDLFFFEGYAPVESPGHDLTAINYMIFGAPAAGIDGYTYWMHGYSKGYTSGDYVSNVVPEPSALVLLSIGGIGFSRTLRRRPPLSGACRSGGRCSCPC